MYQNNRKGARCSRWGKVGNEAYWLRYFVNRKSLWRNAKVKYLPKPFCLLLDNALYSLTSTTNASQCRKSLHFPRVISSCSFYMWVPYPIHLMFNHRTRSYIHNWSLQPFKSGLRPSFSHNFIRSHSFCQKSAERKSPKKYFHIFVSMSDRGYELGPYV